MKSTIICLFLGLLTKDEAVRAIRLNKATGNICINELGEDTNQLLGIDTDYELVELDDEPKKDNEAELKKMDDAATAAKEKTEHEAEKKAKDDAAQAKKVEELSKDAKKEAAEADDKIKAEEEAKKKKDDEENGISKDKKHIDEPKEMSVTAY